MIKLDKQDRVLSQEEIDAYINSIYNYAADLIVYKHLSYGEAKSALIQQGLNEYDAETVIKDIVKFLDIQKAKTRRRNIFTVIIIIAAITLLFFMTNGLLFKIGCVAIVAIAFDIFILEKYLQKKHYPITTDRPLEDNLGLYKIQGIGFEFMGHYRVYQATYATYRMLTLFWLPLIPLNCVRVRISGSSPQTDNNSDDMDVVGILLGVNYKESDISYDIYSYEKWVFFEVMSIYLSLYGYTIAIGCLLIGIAKTIF
ncbi:MAG: hypothetical protein J5529_11025 [Prevotella sp.]|nr:hypothetical protein [Prevotella sp.]